MAMYEVGALLSPYSHYLLASELLEPGHGWDYSAPIKGLIQQRNAAGQSLTSFEAKDIGDLVIKGYMDQAAYYETSGLTLGLLDLDIVSSTLKTAVNSMTKYMSTQLQNSPGRQLPGWSQSFDLTPHVKSATQQLTSLIVTHGSVLHGNM